MKICQLCYKEFANHYEINGKVKNLQNRKYCLECSPFGIHNTKKLTEVTTSQVDNKVCLICKEKLDASHFYRRYGKKGLYSYCKKCSNEKMLEKQRRLKLEWVQYKGGKCIDCGIVGHPAIYDFHHSDSNGKDFNIAKHATSSFGKVKGELDKCELLCSNCHRIRHAKY